MKNIKDSLNEAILAEAVADAKCKDCSKNPKAKKQAIPGKKKGKGALAKVIGEAINEALDLNKVKKDKFCQVFGDILRVHNGYEAYCMNPMYFDGDEEDLIGDYLDSFESLPEFAWEEGDWKDLVCDHGATPEQIKNGWSDKDFDLGDGIYLDLDACENWW